MNPKSQILMKLHAMFPSIKHSQIITNIPNILK